jgi:hypothetical protein
MNNHEQHGEPTGGPGVPTRGVAAPAIQAALHAAYQQKQKIRVFYGDPATGRDWLEENDVCGWLGRAAGLRRSWILLARRDSAYGAPLLDARILRLLVAGREVYRHPAYQDPVFACGPSTVPTHPFAVFCAASRIANVANFRTALARTRWLAFMTGQRMGK